jgi:hypothetical protein
MVLQTDTHQLEVVLQSVVTVLAQQPVPSAAQRVKLR